MAVNRGPEVDIEVSELLQKHNVNEKAPYYLLSSDHPITTLASAACLGESPELIEQLFKDAGITHLPLILSDRAFFREAQAKYAATLVIVRTPSRARGTLSLLTPINLDVKSVFSIAIPNRTSTPTYDVDFWKSFRNGSDFTFQFSHKRRVV